jgi:hypothetical protein
MNQISGKSSKKSCWKIHGKIGEIIKGEIMAETATLPTERIYNKFIGYSTDNEYYFLHKIDEVDGERSIEVTVVRVISEEELDEMVCLWDEDNSAWRQAVWGGETTESADNWHEDKRQCLDTDDLISLAPRYICDALQDKIGSIDGYIKEVDCGSFYLDMEWENLYEPNLWQIIKRILHQNNPIDE